MYIAQLFHFLFSSHCLVFIIDVYLLFAVYFCYNFSILLFGRFFLSEKNPCNLISPSLIDFYFLLHFSILYHSFTFLSSNKHKRNKNIFILAFKYKHRYLSMFKWKIIRFLAENFEFFCWFHFFGKVFEIENKI